MANKEFKIQSDTVSLNGVNLSASVDNKIVIPGVTRATGYRVDEVNETDDYSGSTYNAGSVVVIDNAQYLFYNGDNIPSGSYVAAQYTVELDDGEPDDIEVDVPGLFLDADRTLALSGGMWITDVADAVNNWNAGDWTQIPFKPRFKAESIESDIDSGGGGAGPVQPYLELTNTPLITQPVVLGTPVTVTVPVSGQSAEFTVVIGNTSTTMSYGIASEGTGYVVGQIYKIFYDQIGGNDASGDITFTISEVNETGGIVAIDNVLWTGPNNDGTYTSLSIQYQPSVFDEISPGVVLTRGYNQGIYNAISELEYDNNTHLSPLNTEWNSEGWSDLVGFGGRTFTTWRQALNNAVGENILAAELIMRDTTTDRYYKFDFTSWGGNNGGYAYTRTEITDPNYFAKPHNAENDAVDIIEDDSTLQIGITRTDNTGIYNPFQEEGFSNSASPAGTTWNADGWDDLSDIQDRDYVSFDAAANDYNNVLGKKFVMYVASISKYYAIEFTEWANDGVNNNFAYVRYEIDQTKIIEGITFADGTRLKSADGIGRVKLRSAGNRRIEEVSGYNEVSVTARTTGANIPAVVYGSDALNPNWYLNIVWDPALDVYVQGTTSYSLEVSVGLDVWYPAYVGGYSTGISQQIVLTNGGNLLQAPGDTAILYRIITGADPVVWWSSADLPSGSSNFRGAVIDYHAYTSESTIIGTIHIVDDDAEENITHTEVQSGSTDGENDDLWFVQNEGTVSYRRIDGESKTLKVQWTAKVFYGSETYD